MLVIGIDPGTATTGYGFIQASEDGILQAIDYGVIETSPNYPAHQRLLQIFQQLQKMIDLHQPDSGAVEKLFFQRNVKTAISVGQGRGVAMLALAKAGITMAEYSPLEIKQAVAGYGRADKNQMQNMVKALLSLDELPSPDDAADALAVAICHVHSEKFKTLLNGMQ